MKFNIKKISAAAAAFAALMSVCSADALQCSAAPRTDDTGYAEIVIRADSGTKQISPYIFGINDRSDIDLSDVSATVVKQYGAELSTYNWETNYSNTMSKGISTNGISLVEGFPDSNWNAPALYTDHLWTKGFMYDIPVRLVNLQLMGFVANDAMGVVSENEDSFSKRWASVRFQKNDSYLNTPNTADDTVYIDEYVGYLVNKYGTASDGGFKGYFLDSEPDRWDSSYPVLRLGELDVEELTVRSAELSAAVKIIDDSALIFGPSLSGAEACINGDGSYVSDNNFIDEYLMLMKAAGERSGQRLLDVLDVHFYTQAHDPSGELILDSDSRSANTLRMQAPRILWDPEYTENSDLYSNAGDYLPFLPSLKGSVEECYPGTKLSLSEYSFGGGSNISGTIAEIDALGIFAENGVYLACLTPDKECEYQKAGINIFTDYNGRGAAVGNYLAETENTDSMSSCYATMNKDDNTYIWIIASNKNSREEKTFDITVDGRKSYQVTQHYTITSESPDIVRDNDLPEMSDNSFDTVLEPMSVELFILKGTADETEETAETVSETEESVTETEEISETASENPADATLEIVTDTVTVTTVTVPEETEEVVSQTTAVPESESLSGKRSSDETQVSATEPLLTEDIDDKGTFPVWLKAIVILMISCCGAGILYILIIEK